MLIDWFTVGAQALNFLILVGLMKRYLYKPILHAIDEREKRIAAELGDAATKKTEAQKEHDEFLLKNQSFDQQRAALLTEATDEVKLERARLIDLATKAADALGVKRQASLEADARNLNKALLERAQQAVFAIARKALADLATTGLEERIADVFNRRLRSLSNDAHRQFAGALKDISSPVLIRSAFPLQKEQCDSIQNAVNETFSANVPIRFETSPDLVAGIELAAGGQKVAWTIADYLQSLKKGVDDVIGPSTHAASRDAAASEPKQAPKAA